MGRNADPVGMDDAVRVMAALMERAPKEITNVQLIAKTMRLLQDLRDYQQEIDLEEYPMFTKTTRGVSRVTRPTLAAVEAYMAQHSDLDAQNRRKEAQKFMDNQSGRGWPTKDWKASVRTWLGNISEGRFSRVDAKSKKLMSYGEMDAHARRNGLTAGGKDYTPVKMAGMEKPLWREK